MNYEDLINLLVESFKTGVPKNITADKLREALIKIAQFANVTRGDYQGTAGPSTNPGTPSTPVYYFAGQSGTYTNFGGITVDASEGINILSYSGSAWSKTVVPIELGGVVKDLDLVHSPFNVGKNKIDLTKEVLSRFVNSDGTVGVSNNAKSIIGQEVLSSTTYTISGTAQDSLKKLVVRDSSNNVLMSQDFASVPLTFTTPSNAATVDFTYYRNDTGGSIDTLQIEIGSEATAYETPKKGVSELKGSLLIATRLSEGNDVPDPVTNSNAVNLKYLKQYGVLLDDITVEEIVSDKNLLNPDYLAVDVGLNSDGNPVASTGARSMVGLPVQGSTTYTLSGIYPDNLKKLAFFDENGNKLGTTISLTNIPRTVTSPADAKTVNISLRRHTNDPVDILSVAQFEKGDQATEYEAYTGDFVTKIKDIPLLSSKNSSAAPPSVYDQNLNTTDNVEFNSITAGGFKAILPEGAGSPPAGVQIGDAWVDTTNDTIKVRRS